MLTTEGTYKRVQKVHIMRMVLGATLARAMREELIATNVARLTSLPPPPPKKVKPWTADEARAFLHAARNEPLYPAFVLLVVYGFRRGEVLGLGWEDVDLDDDVIRVLWQLQRVDGALTRTEVKTEAGKRDLPLLPIVRDGFVELAERQMFARRQAGVDWQETGLISPPRRAGRSSRATSPAPSNGSPPRPACAGSGFMTCGTPRRRCSSGLASRRVTPRRSFGHARISVTLEIYTHGDNASHREGLGRVAGELFKEPEN